METILEYIDFSDNEESWRVAPRMTGLGQSIYEEGFEEGKEEGMEQGIAALILDHIEEHIPRERSIQKLQKRFALTRGKAEKYYECFADET